jgi:hypothetical protein
MLDCSISLTKQSPKCLKHLIVQGASSIQQPQQQPAQSPAGQQNSSFSCTLLMDSRTGEDENYMMTWSCCRLLGRWQRHHWDSSVRLAGASRAGSGSHPSAKRCASSSAASTSVLRRTSCSNRSTFIS